MTDLYILLAKSELLGIELFDSEDFFKLIVRFASNLVSVLIIVRLIYYPIYKKKDYAFTFLLINTVVFMLCFLLDNVKLQMGLALGLFAIFGIIRYRTNPIPNKEMTYLFVVIGLSVLNALANKRISYAEIIFTNAAVIFIIFAIEKLWKLKHESTKLIIYENIDLIHPDKREELIADLEDRTGIKITRIDIGRIDYLRDVAKIFIYYTEDGSAINMADEMDSKSDSPQ